MSPNNLKCMAAISANHISGAVNLVRAGVVGVCPAAYFTIFASALSAEKALCCTATVSLELREGAGYTLELPYLMQMNTTKTSL